MLGIPNPVFSMLFFDQPFSDELMFSINAMTISR